jgi:Holliday junction DNA helicase RuvA
MIGRLTGKVAAQEPDGGVVLDVGGVGYELTVPLGTLGRCRADDGAITLWVHTHVREDALALYGFSDENERRAFRTLLGVSNVGPRIAVAVLSALPAAELGAVVARRDLGALTSVPGVGKKIAERLLLELRDRLPAAPPAAGPAPTAERPRAAATDTEERLRGALTGMGFRPAEAERAVSGLVSDGRIDRAPFEELIREALASLAR